MKKIIPFHKEIPFKTNLAEITSISLEHTMHPEQDFIRGAFIVSGEYKISDNSNCVEAFSYDIPFETEFVNCNLDKAMIDIHDFYYEIVNSSVLTVHIELCVQNIIEDPIVVKVDMKEEPAEILENIENTMEEEKIAELVREKVEEDGVDNLEHIERQIQNLFDKEEKEEVEELPHEEKMEEVMKVTDVENKKVEVEAVTEKKEEKIMVEETNDTPRGNDKVAEILEQMDTKETYTTYKLYIVRENDSLETIIEKYDTTREELNMYNNLTELKIGDKIMIPSRNA